MRTWFSIALIVSMLVACTDPDEPVTVDDVSTSDPIDVSTFDTAPEDVGVDTAPDVSSDAAPDALPDAEPDRPVPEGCDAGLLGCPCEDDGDCADSLCVSVGFGAGRVCSEFCDGACSEAGYACEPFNVDGREVNACFPIGAQCEPCDALPGCGADVNACLTLDDGSFCVGSCAIHGFCPSGTTCLEVDSGGTTLPVCVPDSGVCAACLDPDEDGYGIGHECTGADCRQDDDLVFEGAPEICDNKDNDCDLEMDEGFDLLTDPLNCGACGTVCTPYNAAPACTGGVCDFLACLDGFADCNDDPEDGCEADLADPALCGTCEPLAGRPGDPCGTCGSGTWICDGAGAVVCDGDLGDDAVNACGGCGALDGDPGTSCGECLRWVCGADGVSCEVAEDELNGCGGCGELSGEPGTTCGECGLGTWTCDGPDTFCVGGSDTTNACGGCAELIAEPGDTCGPCGLDLVVCAGVDAVTCDGATDGNACEGCEPLEDDPGEPCGPCGLDTVVCDGTDAVVCDGATAINECGGCRDLFAEVGTSCGTCDAGEWACNGPDTVSCRGGGDDARNLCGGCSELEDTPGGPCGPCDDGLVMCNGTEATLCIDASEDPDGDGACGVDDVCPGFDDRADADGDTVPDGCDLCAEGDDRADGDGDSVPDGCDLCAGDDALDDDGDGVPDACDVCGAGDDALDADADTVPDACDVCEGGDDRNDIDGDTVPDTCDACADSDDRDDGDGDGVPDECDICLAGDDATDTDGDTTPDACDLCEGSDDRLDEDDDGVPDGCDTGLISPGDTTTIAEYGGWSIRCLAWEGTRCVHMQQTATCDVCGAYPFCGEWHDVSIFNNGSNRTPLNWCMLATGVPGVDWVGTGPGSAVSPVGCGYSASHPLCSGGEFSIHIPGSADPSLGLLLNDGYCGSDRTMLAVDCTGW